jgi:hypothetical protein
MLNDLFTSSIKDIGKKLKDSFVEDGSEIVIGQNTNLKFKSVLSMNSDLLLESELLAQSLDFATHTKFDRDEDAESLNILQVSLEEAKDPLAELAEHFNKEVRGLKKITVDPKGFYVPDEIRLEDYEREYLRKKEPLPIVLCEKLTVRNLAKEDVMSSSGKRDWLSFMIPDGKVFPYTILTDGELTKKGFPIGLYTKEDQDVSPASIKNVFYIDPLTNRIKKGIYFQVSEAAGPLGDGGINGIIVPDNRTLVIINHCRKEAYYVNVNKKEITCSAQSFGVGVG